MNHLDLSIITVNWNTWEYLERNLASMYQHITGLDFEIIVIDNGSMDGSVEKIKTKFPKVRLIENQTNTGFGYPNNQGFREARGDWILFANDDLVFLENSPKILIDHFQDREDVGVIGCKLLNQDKTLQRSVRLDPGLADQIIQLTKLHNFFPGLVGNYLQQSFDYEQEQTVSQIMGAFMLCKRAALEKVKFPHGGVFDEQYFLWFEEVDLLRRIREAGYKVVYFPYTKIVHVKGTAFAKHKAPRLQKIWNASLLHYWSKWHPTWQQFILLPFTWLALGLSYGAENVKKVLQFNKSKDL